MKIMAGRMKKSFGITLGLALTAIGTISLSGGAYAQVQSNLPSLPAQPVVSGPLSLKDAVQTALKYSPMVRSASSMADAARARVGMNRAMTRPQLSVSAFGGTSSMGDIITSPPNIMPSGIFAVPDKSGVTGQAGLMFPIYTGGRLSGAVRASKALATAASYDRVTAEQNTALETKAAYHRVILAQSSVEVYSKLVKEAGERVRIAEVSFQEGRIAKYDLLRNQTVLADAEQQLATAQRDARIAVVDLILVLGVGPTSDFSLTDTLEYVPVTGTQDYMAEALKSRPELSAARAKVNSAQASVDMAKSAYQPQVYANAMQGVTAVSGGTDTGLTVGVTIGLPIFDGGLRRSSVREAESMLEAVKQDEQQALLGVQRDVNTVWAEIQSAERVVQLSGAAVSQAEEDYRVIRLRYESGKAVNVEVLDALSSLVRAQNNRLVALYEHNIARDRLARAIGEL